MSDLQRIALEDYLGARLIEAGLQDDPVEASNGVAAEAEELGVPVSGIAAGAARVAGYWLTQARPDWREALSTTVEQFRVQAIVGPIDD